MEFSCQKIRFLYYIVAFAPLFCDKAVFIQYLLRFKT